MVPKLNSNLNQITTRLADGRKFTISYPIIRKNISANQYVTPYSYADFFYISEDVIEKYGQVISASALAENGAPIPCNFYAESNGTYFRIVSTSSSNNIYLTCIKIEEL